MTSNSLSRRDFLQYTGLTGTAFLLGRSSAIAHTGTSQPIMSVLTEPVHFTPYIRIDAMGAITIFNTKPEMGQGVFQSIPALIGEELEETLDQVTIQQSNGEKELGTMQRAEVPRSEPVSPNYGWTAMQARENL